MFQSFDMKKFTSKKKEIDLLVFGDTCIDYFYGAERIPQINESAKLYSLKKFFGGMGANTAVISRSLGLNVSIFSVIGSDASDYVSYLQNLGIQLHLKGIFGDTTHSIFFQSFEGFISFFYKGVTEKVDELAKEVKKEMIEEAKCVFMARTYLNLYEKVASMCKKKFLVFNPGYGVFEMSDEDIKKFKKILKNVKVLILNETEYNYLKKKNFNDFNVEILIITKGEKGAEIITKGMKEEVPAYKTTAIDPSGAGDAFNAGFIAAYQKKFNLIDCVKIANATASFVIEKHGCQTNAPNWDMVLERFLEMKIKKNENE